MLTVVTHTNPDWGRDISRSVNSVRAALPPGCRHEIIECRGNFHQARYDAMKIDDVVVFVDDDDYISEDSLDLVLQGLNLAENALVFTNEVIVQANGSLLPRKERNISYSMMAAHPNIVHHMCAVRSKYVTERSLNLATKYNVAIEWIMKCEAAFNGGALHVNHDAYYWVQHTTQRHVAKDWQDDYKTHFKALSAELKSWCNRPGYIMSWNPPAKYTKRIIE